MQYQLSHCKDQMMATDAAKTAIARCPWREGALAPPCAWRATIRSSYVGPIPPHNDSSRPTWGAPCIRGFRMPVETIVAMVAAGMSDDEILTDFPDLEREDIREALRFWKNQPTVPQDALPIAK